MTVSYHGIYWGAYLCLVLLTLLIFVAVIIMAKTLRKSCDPLKQGYSSVSREKRSSKSSRGGRGSPHEEIAMNEQEKPPSEPATPTLTDVEKA
ncbi:hypothetical protein CHUAL_005399 [Chamberlinius hualienensis]